MIFFIFLVIIALYNPIVLGVNISSIFAISLVANGIKYVVLGNRSINNFTVLSFVVLLFYIISFFYCVNSLDQDKSFFVYAKFLLPVIVYVYMCGSFYKCNYSIILNRLLKYMCYANLLACIAGIVFWYFNIDVNVGEYEGYLGDVNGETVYRMKGTFAQANVFAGFLAITFPGIIHMIYKSAYKYRLHCFIMISLELFCLYQTYSRWSIIAIIVSLFLMIIIYIYIHKKIKIRHFILGLFLLMAVIVCIVWLFLVGYFIHEGSNLERVLALQIAFQHAMNNDFLGYGIGIGISNLSFDIILDGTIINLLVDTGIIGVGAYLLMMCITFKLLINKLICSNSFAGYMMLWSFCIFFIISVNESILYNALLNYFLALYIFFSNAYNTSECT